jgi:hypothetical protein
MTTTTFFFAGCHDARHILLLPFFAMQALHANEFESILSGINPGRHWGWKNTNIIDNGREICFFLLKMIVSQQEAHRKEIETLTLTFQAQMTSFESNMRRNNPDRMEYLEDKMERTSNQMDARLDKIIDLLLLNQGSTIGPSPFRKKTRHKNGKEANMDIDHFETLTLENQDVHDPKRRRNKHPDSPTRTSQARTDNKTPPTTDIETTTSQMWQATTTPPPIAETENTASLIRFNPPPALPDSPNQEDATWLQRKTNATIAFTEKTKTLLNPYRTTQETLKSNSRPNRMSTLNAPSTPMGVTLTTLSSTQSDTALRGRKD